MTVASNIYHVIDKMSRGTVIESAPMKGFTSIGVGGPADVLWVPADEGELLKGLDRCEKEGWTPQVLGAGTNVIVRDGGIPGLTILVRGTMDNMDIEKTTITAGAGISLPRITSMAAKAGLSGFEFAIQIPGTLGGAVKMNAGAFGGAVSDLVSEAKVRSPDGNIEMWQPRDFSFDYRSSNLPEGALILEVKIQLSESDDKKVMDRMKELKEKRCSTQPTGVQSAGCVFKNPPGDSAARLIDAAGLKGRKRGGAMISDVHAGYIINVGGATAGDVLALMEEAHRIVFDSTGIDLIPEVQVIGRDGP